MIAVVRLKGSAGSQKKKIDTMKMLNLSSKNSAIVLDGKKSEDKSRLGMIVKSADFVTWGELSPDMETLLKHKIGEKGVARLKPPKGGLRSIRRRWPKGDLGYRGAAINDLIKRML